MDENNKKEQQGNEQEHKQQQLAFNQLEQVDADRALAFALQQQVISFSLQLLHIFLLFIFLNFFFPTHMHLQLFLNNLLREVF